MRKYAPSEQTLQWQTLTPQHMPPIGEDFLLWRACNESDGGLPTLARRWKREGENPPIVYQVGTGQEWKRVLPEEEYKTCRWAAIPPPRCVVTKRIRTIRRRMEMEEQWQKEESEHENQA